MTQQDQFIKSLTALFVREISQSPTIYMEGTIAVIPLRIPDRKPPAVSRLLETAETLIQEKGLSLLKKRMPDPHYPWLTLYVEASINTVRTDQAVKKIPIDKAPSEKVLRKRLRRKLRRLKRREKLHQQ